MREKIKQFMREVGVMSLALSIAFIITTGVFIAKGWTEPQAAAPGGNLSAPINIGSVGQIKGAPIQANNGGSGYYASLGWTPDPTYGLVTNGNTYANDYYVVAAGKWASSFSGGTYITRNWWPSMAAFDCAMPDPFTGGCGCQAGYTEVSGISGQSYVNSPWDSVYVLHQCYK